MAYEKVGTMADGRQFDFTTGQVIAPATPTPTPAPTTAPTSTPSAPAAPVSRYPLGSYEQKAEQFYSGLGMKQPDENAIKESVRKEMQSNIDAINRTYDEMSIQESRVGIGREGQTRALGARSGVLGQDFGNAQMDQTKNLNKQAQNAISEERQIKISGVLNEINKRSEEMIKAKKAEALGNSESYLNFLKTSQTTAREDLKTLAQAGVSIDKLTDEEHTALLEQTGYSPLMLEAVYNASKPKAAQIDYKMEKLANGKILFYGTDPTTGQLTTKQFDYDIPPDFDLQITGDGTPVLMNKQTGEVKIAEGFEQGQFSKPEMLKPYEVNPGQTLIDPITGKVLYQAPQKEEMPASYKEWQLAGSPGTYAEYLGKNKGLDTKTVTQVDKLAASFDSAPIVKQFNEVQNKKLSIDSILSRGTGPSDLAAIYDFMKVLDPSSVVREAEYASAASSGNVFMGTLAKFNGLFKAEGQKLPQEVRDEFKGIINSKYDAVSQQYDNLYSEVSRKINIKTGEDDGQDYLTNYKQVTSSPTGGVKGLFDDL